MTRMHDEIRELLAAVALGAASRDETIQVEAHARGCAECREELHELRAVSQMLALTPVEVEPSPDLRSRIMTQVRAEAADRAAAAGEPATDPVPGPVAAPEQARVRGGAGRGSWWRALLRPWPATAVAMAAVAAGLLVWNVSLQTTSSPTAPSAMVASVSGTTDAPTMRGNMVYVADADALVVRLAGLTTLPPGQAYQLWTIAGGIPTSAGVFRADASGRAVVVADSGDDVEAIGVTAQPADHTTAPEGPLLMTASLSA